MDPLTLASTPEDAAALRAAEAHHARLVGELTARVTLLLTGAGRDPAAGRRIHRGLLAFCDRAVLPHLSASAAVLYPAARALPEARPLIDGLIAEHACLGGLVGALRSASPAGAIADARALQVLLEEHLAKETGLVLPLLAMAPGIRLSVLHADLDRRLSTGPPETDPRAPGTREGGEAGGGGGPAGTGGA
ncbi:hemerythrin domain-containing protein [Streptomyces sp. SCSIO 75703]|uniref:hemerythrin domain-containing protein n=1 Tax=Streptomyces sp. SCSIO 75703 TaxID=3112165 RepID=UPI0030D3CA8A